MLRELIPPETPLAFQAIKELRPHLESADSFTQIVDDVQRAEGYRLVGAFEDGTEHAVAVAGFRVIHSMMWGKFLYIDDLSTLPHARRRGHGRSLLDWTEAEARRLGCTQLDLDSGVGHHRIDAHRSYFNAGLEIIGFHFARPLD